MGYLLSFVVFLLAVATISALKPSFVSIRKHLGSFTTASALFTATTIASPNEAAAETFSTYKNARYETSLNYPSSWQTNTGSLSGERSVVAFTDPNDADTSASIVFTPVPADYTKLNSFGGKDNLRLYLLPSGEGVATKLIQENVKGECYFIEYVVSAEGAPVRHVQSVFALRPQESVVGLTLQTKEETFEKHKAEFDEMLPSFKINDK